MDFLIKFVGIILLVSSTGQGVAYRALVPRWTENETFCPKQATVPEHRVYLRVGNGDINAASTWPLGDRKQCDPSENCTLFPITKTSTISINPGFTIGNNVHEHVSYCLVPQLKAEGNNKIQSIDESGALVKMDLPGGDLSSEQLVNGAIISSLRVPAPPEKAEQPSTVLVTVIDADQSRLIVVNPGGTIILLSSSPDMAVKALTEPDPHASDVQHAHFLLFNKLLPQATQLCDPLPRRRPCGPHIPHITPGAGVIGDFVCSVGGFKP